MNNFMSKPKYFLIVFFILILITTLIFENFDLKGLNQNRTNAIKKVVYVSSLDNDGDKTLRQLLKEGGNKIIKFKVAGKINLQGMALEIKHPYLEIDGASAPSPGITIVGAGIKIRSHHIKISNLYIRPGDDDNFLGDAVEIYGPGSHNIVVDHCSLSWATDEVISASGPSDGPTSHDIVISNNIIAEGLMRSIHPKGNHSMGLLVHDNVKNVNVYGNYFVSNNERNPRFKSGSTGTVFNNLIYNPGRGAIRIGSDLNLSYAKLDIVNNVFIAGKDTQLNYLIKGVGKVYQNNNFFLDRNGNESPFAIQKTIIINKAPFYTEKMLPIHPKKLVDSVIKNSGARIWDFNKEDNKFKQSLVSQTAKIVDHPTNSNL
jgi:hypothetical protein